MAGIYVHIPFCRKLCYYCDFHFTVSLKQKGRVISAIKNELEIRKDQFKQQKISTIYFGGGTPSILTPDEILNLLHIIKKHYRIQSDIEITLEANPDDLTSEYINDLKKNTPVNRLSIGVQSFNDRFLQLMNRRHSADEANECIKRAHDSGFKNINIDLIYGIPGMTLDDWKQNLTIFSKLQIPHLSAYHLSIEPRTVFAYYLKKGEINPITEEASSEQFEYLMQFTRDLGYDHYEISNFALPGHYSRHNLGYWKGDPYLGIGPSAHSYDLDKRRWNISNNTKYCEEIENRREGYYDTEIIDQQKGFNDYLITAIRTQWGINLKTIGGKYGEDLIRHIKTKARKFIDAGQLISKNDRIYLSNSGKMIADYIIRDMIILKPE